MNFGRHPLLEALHGILYENAVTLGSFTHAFKCKFDVNNDRVRQAVEDNFSCDIPGDENRIFYGTIVGEDGGVLEDFMCYVDEFGYLNVVGNICNRDVWYCRFGELFESESAEDITQERGILYLYGNQGKKLIQALTGVDIDDVGWRGVRNDIVEDIQIDVAVTTYTPFGGAEISFDIDQLSYIWDRIYALGQELEIDVGACGLTGRDVARMSGGLPLGGLDYRIQGLQVPPQSIGARLKDGEFIGKEEAQRNPIRWKRVYIPIDNRRLTDDELKKFEQANNVRVSSVLFIPGHDRLVRELRIYYKDLEKTQREELARNILQFLESVGVIPGNHLFILGTGLNRGVRMVTVSDRRGKENISGYIAERRRIWQRE